MAEKPLEGKTENPSLDSPEKPTTLEDIVSFFDRDSADVELPRDLSGIPEDNLASYLTTQLKSAFSDINIVREYLFSPKDPVTKAAENDGSPFRRFDLLIEVPSSGDRAVVGIGRFQDTTTLLRSLQQFKRTFDLYSNEQDVHPAGFHLIVSEIDGVARGVEIEELVAAWLEDNTSPIRVLMPQQSLPVIFQAYQPAEPAERMQSDAARIYMLSDDALQGRDGDLLGFGEYAAAFGGLINDETTVTPLTLAINAKWGVGKTSLAHMIEEHLVQGRTELGERPHVTYWFNAWLHDEATDLGQAFMTDIVRFTNSQRPLWKRLLRPLPTSLYSDRDHRRRRWWIGAGLVLIALVISVFAVEVVGIDVVKTLKIAIDNNADVTNSGIGSIIFIFALSLVLLRYLTSAFESVSDFLSKRPSPADTGTLGRIREQLEALVADAVSEDRKFVVFIDDLERCRPTRSIDVLEAVNQLLSFPSVVTIIIADMAALAANAEIKYDKLAKRYNPETGETSGEEKSDGDAYGRLFLQKFTQLQFDLPEPSESKIRRLVIELSEKATPSDDAGPKTNPERLTWWQRVTFDDMGTIFVALGKKLFAPWQPKTSAPRDFGTFLRSSHWALRPLAAALWILLLPYFWMVRLGQRASRAGPLRSQESTMASIGKGAIIFCIGLSAYHVVLFALQRSTGLFGWHLLTVEDIALFLISFNPNPDTLSTGLLTVSIEIARLVDFASQVVVFYLPAVAAGLAVFFIGVAQRVRQIAAQREQAQLFEHEFQTGAAHAQRERPTDSLLGEHAWQALYLRKRQQFLTKDSDLFTEARDYAFRHLLLVPRNAKRLLNRLRLNLFILDQLGAFSHPSQFGPSHLGKWVALHERWPELAVAITRDTAIMNRIEEAIPDVSASVDAEVQNNIFSVLETLKMQRRPADDAALIGLLTDAPHLAPVIRRLAMFEVENPTG